MEAPKRIHIRWGKAGDTRVTYMEERFFPPDNEAEYILATEHARIVAEKDARIAELEKALKTARRDAFEEAAKVAEHLQCATCGVWFHPNEPHTDDICSAGHSSWGGARDAKEIAAAIRAMKGEKPFDILPEGHSVVRQEGTGGADFSGSVRAMKGE